MMTLHQEKLAPFAVPSYESSGAPGDFNKMMSPVRRLRSVSLRVNTHFCQRIFAMLSLFCDAGILLSDVDLPDRVCTVCISSTILGDCEWSFLVPLAMALASESAYNAFGKKTVDGNKNCEFVFVAQ